MTSRLVALLALLVPLIAPAEEELLAPEEAFRFTLEATGPDSLRATWEVADGYYLYRDKLDFKSETEGVSLGEPILPPGKVKNDEFFGRVETYRGQVSAEIPIERTAGAPDSVTIDAGSQGCADLGVCYPPHRQKATVRLASMASAAASNARETLGEAGGGSFRGEDEVLDPDVAFVFSTEVTDGNTLVARWDIEPEHYLYRDKLNFELRDSDGVSLGTPRIPAGKEKNDEFFGRIQVFYDEAEVRLPLNRENLEPTDVTLVAGYQGCADAGICYPPMKKEAALKLPAGAATASESESTQAEPAPIAPASDEPLSEQDSLAQSLATGSSSLVLGTFFVLGLLLAFTPCVFPMIPILSSIIVGQGDSLTTRKAFTLSSVYVLAMAVTYTVAGVIAGLFGANLQAAFQDPWILSAFAAVFVLLSLSMFGFYELQLPSRWQSKLSEVSNRQQGGSLTGVAIMGLLSALIVGPCVAPPLMGALIYIGQTGDPWLGGAALFALSLGMGAPLVAIGPAGGKLLPRAGGWMDAVK
ncbi:protein-disulfide reductase DsbD, partial [Thiohalomonas denitrificans]|uniref:protein-disulfide reductase DsbD n=1 Tax=Thiohalomonas denitrificans TaxID=415747 RepID=UPI0026E9DA54